MFHVILPRSKVRLFDLKSREPTREDLLTSFNMGLWGGSRFPARTVRLRVWWDGSQRASIDTPVGDFFCCAFWKTAYVSRLSGFRNGLWYSRWPMPFRSARFELENMGPLPVTVRAQVRRRPFEEPTPLRFHAKFRRENGCTVFDYPFLRTEGRGRFVGVVMNIDCPWTGWWGEGDEKVWVDGEEWPSWWGTGSEDYFKDAWGMHRHGKPFEGCPLLQGPGFSNKTSMYRWHILDSIPFSRSFRMTIENYADRNAEKDRVDYSSTAFWYQEGVSGKDFFKPYGPGDCIPRPYSRMGALEAEDLEFSGPGKRLSLSELELLSPMASEYASGSGCLALDLDRSKTFFLTVPTKRGEARRLFINLLPSRCRGVAAVKWNGKVEGTGLNLSTRPKELSLGIICSFKDTGQLEFDIEGGSGTLLVDAVRLEEPPREAGVVEAEDLRFSPSGWVVLDAEASGWQAVEFAPKRGAASFQSSLPVGSDGIYGVDLRLHRGPGHGRYRFEVAGRTVEGVFNGRAPRASWVIHHLGDFDLKKGKVTIRFTYVGEKGGKNASLALDYIRLWGPKVRGAIEGESLRVIDVKGGRVTRQRIHFLSGTDHAWVLFTRRGGMVKFALPVKESGSYEVFGRFVRSYDYGTIQLAIDGKKVGKPFNAYSPTVVPSDPVRFGKIELKKGEHTLSFTVVGKDPDSAGYFMGLDYILLKPLKRLK